MMAFSCMLSFFLILSVSSAVSLPKQLHHLISKSTTLSPVEINLAAFEKASIPNNQISTSSSLPVTARQTKLTGEQCKEDSECAGFRSCRLLGVNGGRCIPDPEADPDDPESGVPGGVVPCTPGSCTTPGEVCALLFHGFDETYCVSQKVSGLLLLNEPCISVNSLQHLSREQLVFEKDRLANVLCDENDSCATLGHMVLYHGNAMMMKSYCQIVGACIKKVMYVNNPRYRKALTVTSKSENMVFTAFSARYVTRAEEGFLSAAIRLGF